MPASDRDADLLTYARQKAHTQYHPTSTCAIGSVVDPELRGARPRRAAGGGRLGDANSRARQHQRPHHHDRREGRRPHQGRPDLRWKWKCYTTIRTGWHAAVPVEFGVLGELHASRGGHALRLGSPQQRGILALLLLRAGKLVSAEELIDRMWGANPPISARVTVRTYISRLRRSPGRRPTGSFGDRVHGRWLPPAARLHRRWILRFSNNGSPGLETPVRLPTSPRLRPCCAAALSLWRGYPLAGAHGQFVEQERDRLEQIRLGALEERICRRPRIRPVPTR